MKTITVKEYFDNAVKLIDNEINESHRSIDRVQSELHEKFLSDDRNAIPLIVELQWHRGEQNALHNARSILNSLYKQIEGRT